MTTRQEAKALVADHIAELAEHYGPSSFRAVVQPELTHEFPFGWVVFYNFAQFLRTGDVAHIMIGNAPFLVERESGRLLSTGTAEPIEDYIERYLETGDPNGILSTTVVLRGWTEGALKVPATKAIRKRTGMGLAASKAAVDSCLAVEPTALGTPDSDSVGHLVAELSALGWIASRKNDEPPPHGS